MRKRDRQIACFERASPALKEMLLKIYRAERPLEIDHHMHEFGSVHYHVQCPTSDSLHVYLSISTPLLSQGFSVSTDLPRHTLEMVNRICPAVMETVDPPKEGYQLTLKLNFEKIPHGKVSAKIMTDISSVQSVILSSQLKEMLRNISSREISQGMYKPIKLVYHPREPFFVIKQQAKITAVFPMNFKESEDVVIATAFFQELMDVGSSKACAKAPHCLWSPIPPPELRGEPIEDLSTNCGFVLFDIGRRHVESKKLDKTVWNLLNLYTFVKYYVKSTRGFIQRRMRTRLQRLVQPLQQHVGTEEEDEKVVRKAHGIRGYKRVREWISASKSKILKRKYYDDLTNKLKRIRSRIKIKGFSRTFRRQWRTTMPKFSPSSVTTKYTRLE